MLNVCMVWHMHFLMFVKRISSVRKTLNSYAPVFIPWCFIKTKLKWLEECIVRLFSFTTFYAIIRRWMARKWVVHDIKYDVQASCDMQFLLLTYKKRYTYTSIYTLMWHTGILEHDKSSFSKNARQTHFVTKVGDGPLCMCRMVWV